MVDGTSTESLALEVARKFALPPAILRRATSLYQVAPPVRSPSVLLRGPTLVHMQEPRPAGTLQD